MSNFLQGKTPISFLQELCTKRGITPQYDLVSNEGAVHEPSFVFKVSAGEFVGTGKGPSKKKAKHNAALSVLNQMTGLSNGHAQFVEDYSELPTNVDGQAGNPVGQLQEMTQKRLWRPPVYEFASEQGPPHARQFVCTVRLGKLSATGTAKSKKSSKRNAAQAMIETIGSGINIPNGDVEQPSMTNGGIQNALPGKSVASNKNSGFCKVLDAVAKDHRFDVSYVDIQERNEAGKCQSLVQLSSMPISVCYGNGTAFEDARNNAAQAALHYLRIMTKK